DVKPASARAPPGSVGSGMRMTIGARTYDLATRALVVSDDLFTFAAAGDEAALERALAGGADLVRLAEPTPAMLARCASAGVSVMVPPSALATAQAAGLPSDRIVPDTLLLDVTGSECPIAATAVGVVRGARIVRTDDVRGARRICDVLAAVLEARR
ncbi:MAG: hypothetical protein M3203_04790, partial [Actinomycetota bacterium]|nr:hypothetical protein [Actinomycetota bacterium]